MLFERQASDFMVAQAEAALWKVQAWLCEYRQIGIDALTLPGDGNIFRQLRSYRTPTPLPDSESVSAKLFENAAFQKMTLDVEGVVDGGVDRQETLRCSR